MTVVRRAAPGGRARSAPLLGRDAAQILAAPLAEQDAIMAEQSGPMNLRGLGPSGRAVGGDALHFSRPPDRHGDRHDDGGDSAGGGNVGAFDENVPRIGVVSEPPPEECRRLIEWTPEEFEPRATELGLKRQAPSDPFRCPPNEGEHDGADQEYLAPKDLGRVHGDIRSGPLSISIATGRNVVWRPGYYGVQIGRNLLSRSQRYFVIQRRDGDDRLA